MPSVFSVFRRRLDGNQNALLAIERHSGNISLGLEVVAKVLASGFDSLRAGEPAAERLEELERSRGQFEADCEALLMRAEGKLKAAANAEARTRTMKKSYETRDDPVFSDSEETEPEVGYVIPDPDADLIPPQTVLGLRVGLASNHKENALRMKFS